MFGEFVRAQPCPRCSGAGRTIEQPCEDCEGSGRVVERRTLAVEDPAGIHDGQRIRLSGEGHVGSRGARRRRLRPRARQAGRAFRPRGRRRLLDARPDDRGGGARDDANGRDPDGESELTFQAGTQPGEVRVLSGRGMPVLQGWARRPPRARQRRRPRHLSPEQRELLEEFERSTGAENTGRTKASSTS